MHPLTRLKFSAFSVEKQHKKCAELVKAIYEEAASSDGLETYQTWRLWMGLPSLQDISRYGLADAYHDHLEKAGLYLKEHHLLPQLTQGDRSASSPTWPIAIYLDHIRSAHNVGSIIRTLEAFALGKLYFSPQTPFVTHKQVKDAAMGAAEWIEAEQIEMLSVLPRPLIALETATDAVSLNEFIFPETFTLALGNEEYGCSEAVLKQADLILQIPLRGRKNSLNVANAFAIVAAEISRQRMTR